MKRYVIEGGKRLEGEVHISGSKNASLPIIASSILNRRITKLYNVPNIKDIKTTLELLKLLGCSIKKKGNKVVIDSRMMNKTQIPENLMRQMRSSIILAGAMIGRFHEATFSYPGGCEIGSRPIDLHLKAFKKLGINIEENYGFIRCSCDRIIGTDIRLDFPSVGATENIILATVLAEGITTIINAAMEPEIEDLSIFLNKMGAKIEGAGTSIIKITGVKQLKEVGYKIMPDRIETGTFLCMVASTGGSALLKDTNPYQVLPIIDKLDEAGCDIKYDNTSIRIDAPKRLKAVDIKTTPYPGFPTDMQSIFSSTLIKAKGTSIVVENIFENRFKCLNELRKMGAKITIEGRTAIINGVRKLNTANIISTDLRGGAALVCAALSTKGKTNIDNIDLILRGYEKLDIKLKNLGAKIYIEDV